MKNNINNLLQEINNIDKKMKELGIVDLDKIGPIDKTDLDSFHFNKEKNSIIFDCKEIKDNVNYVMSLELVLKNLNPNKTLHFISFAQFLPNNIVTLLLILSEKYNINIYLDKNSDDYKNIKTLFKNFQISKIGKEENFNIKTYIDAEKLNLIRRASGGNN